MSEVVLQMNHVTKNFGGVHALTDVSLTLHKGEVLCLVGENGAGKSTLMNVLTGVVQPTSGEIILHGEPVVIKNPSDAFKRGISIVHQELVQMGKLTVAENIFAGRLPTKNGLVDYDQLYKDTEELMDRINIHFDPKAKVRQFSIAQCQLIEILKALSYDSSVIVFDEPTAALTIDARHCMVSSVTFRKMAFLLSSFPTVWQTSMRSERTLPFCGTEETPVPVSSASFLSSRSSR